MAITLGLGILVIISIAYYSGRTSTTKDNLPTEVGIREKIEKLNTSGEIFEISKEMYVPKLMKKYLQINYPELAGQSTQPWELYVTGASGDVRKVASFERSASIFSTSTDDRYLLIATFGDHYCDGLPMITVIGTKDDAIIYESELIIPDAVVTNKNAIISSVDWSALDMANIEAAVVECSAESVKKAYSVKLDLLSQKQNLVR